jgi:hypothetical protein
MKAPSGPCTGVAAVPLCCVGCCGRAPVAITYKSCLQCSSMPFHAENEMLLENFDKVSKAQATTDG